MSTIYYKAILEAIPPSQYAGKQKIVFGTAFENQTPEKQARHIGEVTGLGKNKIVSIEEYPDGESWYKAQYEEGLPVCKNCNGDVLKPMDLGTVCKGYLICHLCGAVYAGLAAYTDNRLFGIYKAPKGAMALMDAIVHSTDRTIVTPRLEWCDKTITVEGKRLNCILDHTGDGRMHQARINIHGVWIEVNWDLGNKEKEGESK